MRSLRWHGLEDVWNPEASILGQWGGCRHWTLVPSARLRHHGLAPHRCCQMTPTPTKSEPVRAYSPLFAVSLTEFHRSTGNDRVSPRRDPAMRSSRGTPLMAVRPP